MGSLKGVKGYAGGIGKPLPQLGLQRWELSPPQVAGARRRPLTPHPGHQEPFSSGHQADLSRPTLLRSLSLGLSKPSARRCGSRHHSIRGSLGPSVFPLTSLICPFF